MTINDTPSRALFTEKELVDVKTGVQQHFEWDVTEPNPRSGLARTSPHVVAVSFTWPDGTAKRVSFDVQHHAVYVQDLCHPALELP